MKQQRFLRLRKKLRSQKGLTLVELMVGTLVLVLLGLMIQTGISLALHSYQTLSEESETQVLLSTASNVLSDELRYARSITVTGDADENGYAELDKYNSVSYGRNSYIKIVSGRLLAKNRKMIAAGAYGNGTYQIETCDIRYNETTGVFKIHLKVTGSSGTVEAEEANLTVQCLNAAV
jgi:Tfp pilus assembly protein PilE